MHRIPFRLASTDKTGQRTPPGQRLPGSSGPADSGFRSSGGAGASLLWNRNLAVPFLVLLAALAVGLMFLMPGGFAGAQSADQFFTYEENGEGPVTTFTASDPEGASPGYWSLTTAAVTGEVVDADIADRALFDIDQNGVLTWGASPSYETNSASGNKEYRVTVQVSDGSMVQYFKAYVAVTDVEETGKVTWTTDPNRAADDTVTPVALQQFQPGTTLTVEPTGDNATLSDPDGTPASPVYKWYRGSDEISGETGAAYTVKDADVGERIKVEVTYSDGAGSTETVSYTSENPVQVFRRQADNTAPAFSPSTVTRRVAENSTAGSNVGGPVTAADANGDILTYSVPADNANFTIDPATGQLMVKAGATFNYEGGTTSYTVVVTAHDSSYTADVTGNTATVTVNIGDVDEKPTFRTSDPTSTAAGVVSAQPEGYTFIDTDDNQIDRDNTAAIFGASDPEGKSVTLSLTGDDAASFKLTETTASTATVPVANLAFKAKTDFEMPGDRNQDNVYEVTVRASDGTMDADRALLIKVTNVVEGGKVTLSPEDVVMGTAVTATVTHENGVSASGQIANLKWQWQRTGSALGSGQTCPTGNDSYSAIAGATAATYTPGTTDGDVNRCLRAQATYNYQFATTTTVVASDATQISPSVTNQAPKFKEGSSTFRVVAENVAAITDNASDEAGDNIGTPIAATDANGDAVTYTLSGTAKDLFRGQE